MALDRSLFRCLLLHCTPVHDRAATPSNNKDRVWLDASVVSFPDVHIRIRQAGNEAVSMTSPRSAPWPRSVQILSVLVGGGGGGGGGWREADSLDAALVGKVEEPSASEGKRQERPAVMITVEAGY